MAPWLREEKKRENKNEKHQYRLKIPQSLSHSARVDSRSEWDSTNVCGEKNTKKTIKKCFSFLKRNKARRQSRTMSFRSQRSNGIHFCCSSFKIPDSRRSHSCSMIYDCDLSRRSRNWYQAGQCSLDSRACLFSPIKSNINTTVRNSGLALALKKIKEDPSELCHQICLIMMYITRL